MIESLILLVAGLLLIFLEFFLPGGIMTVLGTVCLLASLFFFWSATQSILWTILYFIGIIVLVAFLIRFTLWRIRTASPDDTVYSDYDQEGYIASSYDKAAIGKEGIVDTDLKPGGHVIVNGKRSLAISQSGYIPKGEKVVIIGGEGDSLLVKQKK